MRACHATCRAIMAPEAGGGKVACAAASGAFASIADKRIPILRRRENVAETSCGSAFVVAPRTPEPSRRAGRGGIPAQSKIGLSAARGKHRGRLLDGQRRAARISCRRGDAGKLSLECGARESRFAARLNCATCKFLFPIQLLKPQLP